MLSTLFLKGQLATNNSPRTTVLGTGGLNEDQTVRKRSYGDEGGKLTSIYLATASLSCSLGRAGNTEICQSVNSMSTCHLKDAFCMAPVRRAPAENTQRRLERTCQGARHPTLIDRLTHLQEAHSLFWSRLLRTPRKKTRPHDIAVRFVPKFSPKLPGNDSEYR
ncbi:hypothetical protein BC834DRAFT_140273 [Gloeopeniophorella convolvens]|nr:hypothetical protein BC834DRAFT_140273 [Gloeopeniophorella convolvens]